MLVSMSAVLVKIICFVTGKPHLVLEGAGPASGRKRTAIAASYPMFFPRTLARALRLVAENNHSLNQHSWASG
eukprot:4782063-Pyramimonas_sp.AAC.1